MLLKAGIAILILSVVLFGVSFGLDQLFCHWESGAPKCTSGFIETITGLFGMGAPFLFLLVGLPLIFMHYLIFCLKALFKKKP